MIHNAFLTQSPPLNIINGGSLYVLAKSLPKPGALFSICIDLIKLEPIVAVAVAVIPEVGSSKVIVGGWSYPLPHSVILILSIFPLELTVQVPDAVTPTKG